MKNKKCAEALTVFTIPTDIDAVFACMKISCVKVQFACVYDANISLLLIDGIRGLGWPQGVFLTDLAPNPLAGSSKGMLLWALTVLSCVTYGSEVCAKESLLYSRPECERDDENLVGFR